MGWTFTTAHPAPPFRPVSTVLGSLARNLHGYKRDFLKRYFGAEARNSPPGEGRFNMSELLNIAAMVASNNLGANNAVGLYKNMNDDLLQTYWLIGISQKGEAHEINTALKYTLFI